ncbi:MAG: hypothetical protein EPN70_04515 [Paraburkholderia sp.]|uniref:hypothetical protein n=1 Tax=Paraburkholderia sp. TaxID=1926495 RepID=UPI001205DBC3|nr:hypothetical protein [Paraburkholderia sp.]TAM06817.1 MAG: hypothetical protein EPN70_04515 [Paraburkholderia sp.]TAM29418.1 MAG: hypothetical protein EPN59_13145 [Paraburkholderia sp.]
MAKTIPFPQQAHAAHVRRNKAMLLPMPRACANDLALQVHLALAALRGGGTNHDAQAMLHTHVLAMSIVNAGYGALTQAQVRDADAALLACFERGRSDGNWRLDAAEADALAAIVTVYDLQLQFAPLWALTEASERLEQMGMGETGQAAKRKHA